MSWINHILKIPGKRQLPKESEKLKKYRIRYPSLKGYRNDVKIEFKSKMEANIFRWLKTRKLESVEYEPELFYFKPNKFGIKAYVPDFKITDGKRIWFIEVKGFFERQDFQKAALVANQYPWIKIYYIDSEKYNLIKEYYSKEITEWE